MKNIILTILICSSAISINAQEMGYRMIGDETKTISASQIQSAKSLKDINPEFPFSWINEFESIQLRANLDGGFQLKTNQSTKLSDSQIELLKRLQMNDEITLVLTYSMTNLPEQFNETSIVYRLVPEVQAKFTHEDFYDYLDKHITQQIPPITEKQAQATTIQFVVDKNGMVSEVVLSESSNDPEIDALIKKVFRSMPAWIPAKDENGKATTQEFEFRFGYMEGC